MQIGAKLPENLNLQQFKVIRGRWCWYQSKAHMRLPITGWLLAQTCCIGQDNAQSIGKVGFSATPGSKTPEPIAIKLGVHNYVGDLTLTSEYGSDRAARRVSAHARSITVCDFLFFLFFVSSTRLQVATVDRFSRSIRQTTRFHASKCLLGVSMMNFFHIYPFYSPKFENRTAITRASLKIEARCLCTKRLFWGSGNLMASTKFASDRPLLPR